MHVNVTRIFDSLQRCEEKSKDREYCKFMTKKVCEEKTFKVPKLVCEEIEEKGAE